MARRSRPRAGVASALGLGVATGVAAGAEAGVAAGAGVGAGVGCGVGLKGCMGARVAAGVAALDAGVGGGVAARFSAPRCGRAGASALGCGVAEALRETASSSAFFASWLALERNRAASAFLPPHPRSISEALTFVLTRAGFFVAGAVLKFGATISSTFPRTCAGLPVGALTRRRSNCGTRSRERWLMTVTSGPRFTTTTLFCTF